MVEPPAVRHERSLRGERAPEVGEGTVRHVVEYEVVPLPRPREVHFRVVDDMVGADRSDQVHVPRAADASHLRAERLRNLHGKGSDAARGTVDQDLLSGPDLAVIADRQEGDGAGHGNGRGLLERQVGRLGHQRIFGDGRVLGKGASQMPGPAEDLVA